MAQSLLQQSLRPGSRVGLTSSVDYFQRRGRADKGGVNTAVDTIKDANIKPPEGTGINVTPSGGESAYGEGYQGGTPGAQPIGMTAEQAQAVGLGSGVASLIGAATNNPGLAQMAQGANAAAQASQGRFGPALNMAGSVLGLNPTATGLIGLGLNPSAEQAVNFGVGLAGLGLPNLGLQLGTGLFGDVSTSIGDMAVSGPTGEAAYGDNGPVDNAQGGMAINNSNDPMGAFMGARGLNVSDNVDAMNDAALGRARSTNENVTAQNGLTVTPGGGWFSPNDMGPQAPDAGQVGPGQNGGFDSSGGAAASDTGQVGPGPNGGFDSSGSVSSDAGPTGPGQDGGFESGGVWKDGGYINQMPGLTQRYMDGGQVMGGQGQMMMGAQPDAQQIQAQVAQMLRDPRRVQQMLARPMQLMQSGELTPDEVVTMGRVAQASMFNPELYPQLRQFVAAQGMNPLPPSYDPMVITKILAVSQALQMVMQGGQGATPPGQVPSMEQAQMQNPTGTQNGGYLQGPGTGRSDSIGTVNETTGSPVKVSNGEYVIPEHVVRAKGRDFFDGLLRKYTSVPKGD